MSHKKVKTEPCLSPQSPFMRKPSKEFLQKIAFNKPRQKQNIPAAVLQSEYFSNDNISKISFIPSGSSPVINTPKPEPSKLKKTTIELGTFKIKHENTVLKAELQQIKRKNGQLVEQNSTLKKQNDELKKQLQTYTQSRISKFSQETLELTDNQQKKNDLKIATLPSLQSLELNSYEILPTKMQVSQANSIVFEDEFRPFITIPLNKKDKQPQSMKQIKSFRIYKENFVSTEIQMLSNRITYLQTELRNSLARQRKLQIQNESLTLCASMSKRKLQTKDSELKQMIIKEKKKKYFEKLFQLSSEEDNQRD